MSKIVLGLIIKPILSLCILVSLDSLTSPLVYIMTFDVTTQQVGRKQTK